MINAIDEKLLVALLQINPVFAQVSETNPVDGNLPDIIKKFLNLLLGISGILAVMYLIYGGIKYVMSAGDAGKAKEAQQAITNALIGLAVALLSFVIISFVFQFLGAEGAGADSGLSF